MLTAVDLLRLKKAADRSLPSVGGSKDYAPKGSSLQLTQIEKALEERRQLLEEERVATKALTTVGTWLPEIQMVQILKPKGKFWQYMGHVERNMLVLFPEEALFLMETGSLQVLSNGLPMSIQDAYHLLLCNDISPEQYNVFAHLCRLGYIVLRHNDGIHFSFYERKIRLDKYADMRQEKGKRTIDQVAVDTDEYGASEDRDTKEKKARLERCGESAVDETDGGHLDSSNGMAGQNVSCPVRLVREEWEGCWTDGTHGEHTSGQAGVYEQHTGHQTEEVHGEHTGCRTGVRVEHASSPAEVVHGEPATCPMEETVHGHSGSVDVVFPNVMEPATFQMTYLDDLFPANVKIGSIETAMFSSASTPMETTIAAVKKPANWTEFKATRHRARHSLLQPLQLHSIEDAYVQLCVSEGVHLTQTPKRRGAEGGRLKLSYDVYLPGKHFRKSQAGAPDIRVAVTRADRRPPTLKDMISVQSRFEDGVAVLFAVVDQGSVAFYNFADVALPVDIHT